MSLETIYVSLEIFLLIFHYKDSNWCHFCRVMGSFSLSNNVSHQIFIRYNIGFGSESSRGLYCICTRLRAFCILQFNSLIQENQKICNRLFRFFLFVQVVIFSIYLIKAFSHGLWLHFISVRNQIHQLFDIQWLLKWVCSTFPK